MLRTTVPHRDNSSVSYVPRDVHEVLIREVRRELQIVRSSECTVGCRQVLHRAAEASPIHVPPGVYGRPEPVNGHAELLALRLLVITRRQSGKAGKTRENKTELPMVNGDMLSSHQN